MLWMRVAGSSGQEDKRAAIKQAKPALDEAQSAYKRRVKEARELSRAEQSRGQALREARRQLQDAQKTYDKRVAATSNRLDQAGRTTRLVRRRTALRQLT
jgi:hypothetical protein